MTALGVVAAWTSPVLPAALAALVFSGDGSAALIVLIALVAPLMALLGPTLEPPANRITAGSTALGVGILLWANFTLVAELGRLAGVDRWYALMVALVIAIAPAWSRDLSAWSLAVLPLGLIAFVTPLIAIAAIVGAAPWSAWSDIASRPAFAFSDRSPWVTDGRTLQKGTMLLFTEPHRVTAVTPGVYRVFEQDDARVIVRESRLGSGDVLALRPGDRLELGRGVRVRFEPGKRVPGVVPSGVAWGHPAPGRRVAIALQFFGATATLIGGAMTVMGGAPSMTALTAFAAVFGLLLSMLAALAWGVYAMYAAPDLSVGAVLLTPLVEMPAAVDTRHAAMLVTVVGVGLVALFAGTTAALHRRTDRMLGMNPGRSQLVWTILCGAAFVAGFWPGDPWRVLLLGLGLLTSTWLAPALADVNRSDAMIGAGGGFVVFAMLIAAGPRLPGDLALLGQYPALISAPLALGVARVAAASRR